MHDPYWGLSDLIRMGFYESEPAIRQAIKNRRLPQPRKIGHKLKWRSSIIQAWFDNGTLYWIPRRGK